MTGVWINADLMSFMEVPGGRMRGFGITYIQDTVKDRHMETLYTKSIKTCPYLHLHKSYQEYKNFKTLHHHFYWCALEIDAFIIV